MVNCLVPRRDTHSFIKKGKGLCPNKTIHTHTHTHTHKELCREQYQYAAPATELSPVRLDFYSQVLISSLSSTYKEAKQHKFKVIQKTSVQRNK